MLDRISGKLHDIVRSISGKSSITEKNVEDAVEEIKLALLEADVNLRVVRRFVNRTLQEAKGEAVLRAIAPGQQFIKIVNDKLIALLGDERQDLELKGPDTTSVILLLGLQGSGKTTTAGKLAKHLEKKGRKPLLVAADLVRPAAVDQLKILGDQNDLPVYWEDGAKDPIKVAKAGLAKAKKDQFDVCIIDTSGRTQVDEALMKEIVKIKSAVKADESLLVADSMTGQNAVDIAKKFDEAVDLSGVILTKFDSDTRGGAALSLKEITGKPIKFVGVGEKIADLDPFYPDRMASRILGMGDIVSLVEKAQETFDEEEAIKLQQKMMSANFTLADYLEQFQKMKKMGPMQSLLEMLPGMKGQLSDDQVDTEGLKYKEAIILSMTKKERDNHLILGPTRRKRIAKGSGTSVFEVNKLIKEFEKMKLMMKKMTKNKKMQAQFMSQFGG
jgi:signal recognition particle subunit SRP54